MILILIFAEVLGTPPYVLLSNFPFAKASNRVVWFDRRSSYELQGHDRSLMRFLSLTSKYRSDWKKDNKLANPFARYKARAQHRSLGVGNLGLRSFDMSNKVE